MKKFYVLLAVAAMLASCAETDLLNPIPESEPQAIGFETFAQKATKADPPTAENSTANYTNGMYAHHESFSVWAYKNTSTNLVFGTGNTTGTNVSVSEGNEFTYQTRYWDKAATKYEFYAAAPTTTTDPKWYFSTVGDVASQHEAYFTLPNVTLKATNFIIEPNPAGVATFKRADADIDYMIADKCPITTYNNAVTLNFIHILSRLNIIAKKSGDAVVKLKSITVNGINLKGSFDESQAAAETTGNNSRWDPATTPVTTPAYSYTNNVDGFALTTGDNYVIQGLVIPQNVKHQTVKTDGTDLGATPEAYIEIVYTISGEEFKAYYNLAAAFGSTGEAIPFNEGWQNTLTITIQPGAISFTGNVADWAGNSKTLPID